MQTTRVAMFIYYFAFVNIIYSMLWPYLRSLQIPKKINVNLIWYKETNTENLIDSITTWEDFVTKKVLSKSIFWSMFSNNLNALRFIYLAFLYPTTTFTPNTYANLYSFSYASSRYTSSYSSLETSPLTRVVPCSVKPPQAHPTS